MIEQELQKQHKGNDGSRQQVRKTVSVVTISRVALMLYVCVCVCVFVLFFLSVIFNT